eukprot:sb/3475826/
MLLLLLATLTTTTLSTHKVAIVGGGVGGASSAFFLRKLLGDDVEITVYEPGEIGGRVRKVTIGGKSFDSGGTIIHSANQYARKLTEKVGKKIMRQNVVLFSGDNCYVHESPTTLYPCFSLQG